MMRVRFPHTARYDSMPVGSSRRAVMTMRVVSDGPRLRLFGGHADHRRRPSSYEWMMRTALRRKGWCESDKAYPPSAGKVSWNAGDRVPCQPTHRMWERSRGAWASQPVIPVMPHAVVRASTAGMGAGIRHEWPDRLWTVRILRPRKGGIRACFRGPTGRGDSPRNCPVRVRIPAKALAETRASTPPIQVLNACLFWERCIAGPSRNRGR